MAVRRTKRGTWKAVVFLRRELGPGGQTHRKELAKTFRLKADAERWERAQLERRDRGTLVPAKVTLDAFFQTWQAKWRTTPVESRERRPRTQEQYERLYSVHWRPSLGNVRLDKIARRDVQHVIDGVRDQCGGRTAQYALAVLHKILHDATKGDLLALNPATDVDVGRRDEREARPLTPDEVNRLLATAEAKEAAAVDGEVVLLERARPLVAALWCVLAYTGLRPSEALALRWDDIDSEHRVLHVRHTLLWLAAATATQTTEPALRVELTPTIRWSLDAPKTKKSRRSVPLVEPVIEVLARHRARQFRRMQHARLTPYRDYGFVFARHDGEPFREDVIYKGHFRRALKEARIQSATLGDGEQRIRLYDLRHTHGSLLDEAGVSQFAIRDVLGHTTVRTTDRYVHSRQEAQALAMDKMARLVTRKA
jgi:integrase